MLLIFPKFHVCDVKLIKNSSQLFGRWKYRKASEMLIILTSDSKKNFPGNIWHESNIKAKLLLGTVCAVKCGVGF